MFKAQTKRIELLAKDNPKIIQELEILFDKKTNVYIDFSNVIFWQHKLNWHIDLKRLKQFLSSFSNIQKVKFYYGTLNNDIGSKQLMSEIESLNYYEIKTKPVKILKLSIDVSSIPPNSPALLQNFIAKPLLSKFNLESIEFLNRKLKELNDQGILYIEDKKCNFDVEIGVDMELDMKENTCDNFVLWSGDSDFSDPVIELLDSGKKVAIFMTARRISSELSDINAEKFDIKKIKEFICRSKELPEEIRRKTS